MSRTHVSGLRFRVGFVGDSGTRAGTEREFGRTWTGDEFRERMGLVEAKGVTNRVLLFLD